MKKIGKKLSYITKVLLVIGLLISNLSSLSIVFADELDNNANLEVTSIENFNATINDENKITIAYTGDVNDADELIIQVNEKYRYSNCTVDDEVTACETGLETPYEVDSENRLLLLGDGMEINYISSVLPYVKFDGSYELTVSLLNASQDNAILGQKTLVNKNVSFEQGIEFKLYDQNDNIIEMSNGRYVISSETTNVSVVGKMLSGGISPNDQFIYGEDETVYSAYQILDVGFMSQINLSSYLFGEYRIPLEINYSKNGNETTYADYLNIAYGTYENNAEKINSQIASSNIVFNSTSKDGYVYIYLGENIITINDIYLALEGAYGTSDNISYVIANNDFPIESGGVVNGYDSTTGETLQEYLSKISVDASTKISITDGFATITYQSLVIGDLEGNNVLDENDVIALIDQLVGNKEIDAEKSNIYNLDDEVTLLDVMELVQIINTGTWHTPIIEQEIELDAKLEFAEEETQIQSGDEFEVNYVLSIQDYDINGIAGDIIYDNTKLELISITKKDGFVGSNKDGKFIYVNPSYESSTSVLQISTTASAQDCVFLTLKFKALAGGTSTITIDKPEYFNQDKYYKIVEVDSTSGASVPTSNVISIDVTVEQSSDNTLSSLKIGNDEITLISGVYDYQLTVANDVTTISVDAITSNVAASISSIVVPKELAIGENTITITVVSETGEEKTYTITVIREKAVEQSNDTVNTVNYQDNTINDVDNEPKIPQNDDDKKAVEDEKNSSILSKVIIIVLTVLVICGLIYLIFKDDDSESKNTNKNINKLKKEDFDSPKDINKTADNKRNQNKNNKKER